jgi:hypothetical protein
MNFRIVSSLLLAAFAAGCATPSAPPPEPLRTSQVDAFLKGGRDARAMGITIYQGPAGKPTFAFANRPHMGRAAEKPMAYAQGTPYPVIDVKAGDETSFRMLVDTSARQGWLVLDACRDMDYRPFDPALGERPDHVDSPLPGYAGVGNKIVMGTMHVESPVFYVPMAAGHLGPLARLERPAGAEPLPDKSVRARENLRTGIRAVMGAEMLKNFDWVRFDFPNRKLRVSSNGAWKAPNADAVVARLPMQDWNGRPAVAVRVDGRPMLAVLDTAGDFEISLPDPPADDGRVELGDRPLSADLPQFMVPLRSHASLGLPGTFPARLGLRILGRYAVTLDYKNRIVWFEDPELAARSRTPSAASDDDAVPVFYRGIVP